MKARSLCDRMYNLTSHHKKAKDRKRGSKLKMKKRKKERKKEGKRERKKERRKERERERKKERKKYRKRERKTYFTSEFHQFTRLFMRAEKIIQYNIHLQIR